MVIDTDRLSPARVSELLATAVKRNGYLPDMVADSRAFVPAHPLKQASADFLARLLVLPGGTLEGQENIDKALQMQKQGHNLLIVGNHQSNGDTPARRRKLIRHGFSELVDRMVFVAGLNVKDTNILFPTEDAIYVFPPRDLADLKKINRDPEFYGVQEDGVETVAMVLRLGAQLNNGVTPKSAQIFEMGRSIFLYLEATRTRDPEGKMMRANPFVSGYLRDEETVVLPIYQDGVHRISPVGRGYFRVGGREVFPGFIRPIPRRVEMIAGEPVTVGQLKRQARVFESIREGTVADAAMFQVWRLAPHRVSSEYRALYDKLASAQ